MRSRPTVLPTFFLIAATAIVHVEPSQTSALLKSAALRSRPAQHSIPQRGSAARARIVEAYGRLPLSFDANRGQADAQVKFHSRGTGYSLFLTSTEAVLELQESGVRRKCRSLVEDFSG